MRTSKNDSLTLKQTPANERVLNNLYQHNFIDSDARRYALDLLYPHQAWGLWIARFLTLLGFSLVLAGMIYFFAFNWDKMPPTYKFITLELGILCAISGTLIYSLDSLVGKLFLTSACIILGVFLAVFGQIYQTGADSFQLFLIWFIVITPWVMVSKFAPLWGIWIFLINVAVILIQKQYYNFIPFSVFNYILLVLNGGFLILGEYFYNKNISWLQNHWQRILLCLWILVLSFISVFDLILKNSWSNLGVMALGLLILISIILSLLFYHQKIIALIVLAIALFLGTPLFGAIIIGSFIFFYRDKKIDLWVLGLTLLTICLIIESLIHKMLMDLNFSAKIDFFIYSLATIVIFSLSAYFLKYQNYKIYLEKEKTL